MYVVVGNLVVDNVDEESRPSVSCHPQPTVSSTSCTVTERALCQFILEVYEGLLHERIQEHYPETRQGVQFWEYIFRQEWLTKIEKRIAQMIAAIEALLSCQSPQRRRDGTRPTPLVGLLDYEINQGVPQFVLRVDTPSPEEVDDYDRDLPDRYLQHLTNGQRLSRRYDRLPTRESTLQEQLDLLQLYADTRIITLNVYTNHLTWNFAQQTAATRARARASLMGQHYGFVDGRPGFRVILGEQEQLQGTSYQSVKPEEASARYC